MNRFDFKSLAYTCLAMGLLVATPSVYGNEDDNDDNVSLLLAHADEEEVLLAAGCSACGGKKAPASSNYKTRYNSQTANNCSSTGNDGSGAAHSHPSNGGGCGTVTDAQGKPVQRASGNGSCGGNKPAQGGSCGGNKPAQGGSCGGSRPAQGGSCGAGRQPSQQQVPQYDRSQQQPQSRGYLASNDVKEIEQVRRNNLI